MFSGEAPRERRDRGVAELGMGERIDGEKARGERSLVWKILLKGRTLIFGEFGSRGLLGMGTAVD